MQVASEILAGLEEIRGREAAPKFEGNAAELVWEFDAMRVAICQMDVDSYTKHDMRFHRTILPTLFVGFEKDALLRTSESLAFDIPTRAAIGKIIAQLVRWWAHTGRYRSTQEGQGQQAGRVVGQSRRNHGGTAATSSPSLRRHGNNTENPPGRHT